MKCYQKNKLCWARTCFSFDKAKQHSKFEIRSDEFDVATANNLIFGTFKDK